MMTASRYVCTMLAHYARCATRAALRPRRVYAARVACQAHQGRQGTYAHWINGNKYCLGQHALSRSRSRCNPSTLCETKAFLLSLYHQKEARTQGRTHAPGVHGPFTPRQTAYMIEGNRGKLFVLFLSQYGSCQGSLSSLPYLLLCLACSA